MKTAFRTLLISFFFVFFAKNIYAQQINTSEITGEENTPTEVSELEKKEEERENSFLNQLLLDIPELTDNPSHIITFVDPSEQKSGVQIEIDGKSFQEVKSPYSLPALSIGNHSLRFKFTDKYGSTQILEKEIVIIPRPPILNSPSFEENILKLSGTGLSNSEIILVLSSGRKILSIQEDIDGDGKWISHINMEDLSEGIYSYTAYTRKYGYASNLAESVTFEIGEGNTLSNINGTQKDIYFSFSKINWKNINNIISSNIDLVILVGTTFTLGFLIAFGLTSSIKNKGEDRKLEPLRKKISENGKGDKELTLKEKLSKDSKEEKVEEEIKKEEKIVTKIDFLKDFKKFDPDDEKGKEKIKVKVTSKE